MRDTANNKAEQMEQLLNFNLKKSLERVKEFLDNEVTEDLICLIGMNRKSKTYDKIFFQLYKLLKAIFINKNNQDYLKIFEIINKITGKSSIH